MSSWVIGWGDVSCWMLPGSFMVTLMVGRSPASKTGNWAALFFDTACEQWWERYVSSKCHWREWDLGIVLVLLFYVSCCDHFTLMTKTPNAFMTWILVFWLKRIGRSQHIVASQSCFTSNCGTWPGRDILSVAKITIHQVKCHIVFIFHNYNYSD